MFPHYPTGYVLKTDDDVFVDTIHLPTFLKTHNVDKMAKQEKLILCFGVENAVPGKAAFTFAF